MHAFIRFLVLDVAFYVGWCYSSNREDFKSCLNASVNKEVDFSFFKQIILIKVEELKQD